MGGSTKKIDTTPSDVTGLRSNLANWLQTGGPTPGGQAQFGQPGGGMQAPQQQVMTAPGANATPQGYNGGMSNTGSYNGGVQQQGMGMGQWQSGGQMGPSSGVQRGGLGSGGGISRSSGFMAGQMDSSPTGDGRPMTAGGALTGQLQSQSDWQAGRDAWLKSGGQDGPDTRSDGTRPPQPTQAAWNAATGIPNNFMNQFGPGGGETPPPWNPSPGGGQQPGPQGQGGFGQMNNQFNPQQVNLGPTAVASAPGQINPMQINPNQIPQVGQGLQGPQMLNPGDFNPMGSYQAVGTQFGVPQAGGQDFMRGQIGNVQAQSSGFNPTQSVDQLGGVNSAFFRNMQGQLSPAFQQQRAEALAQAKESMGNMGAGTGLANALGTAMNRSLGNEQATLANYASQGLQTEVGRQMGESQLGAQVGMANAGRDLQGQMANQGADSQFLNTLLAQSQQRGQLGLQGQQLGLQGQMANQGTMAQLGGQGAQNALQASLGNQQAGLQGNQQTLQAQGQNAGNWLQSMLSNQGAVNNSQAQNISNSMNTQQFNAGQMNQMNLSQGQLSQAYQQLASQMGDANAQRYMQMLLGMSTQGVGPSQVVQNPGWGAAIGQIAGTGLGAMFGGVGAGVGGAIGKKLGGG